MSVCEILPNLWLGNIVAAKNAKFLLNNNIDIIINCSKDLRFFSNKTINYRVAVHDNLEKEEVDKFYEYLDKIIPLIHTHLNNNKTIFVHCYAGKQRSASIVACYLIKYGKLTLKQSIDSIKSKRLVAFTPGINFNDALLLYEKSVSNTKIR